MNWSWRLGMIILTGAPAIIGGGIVWFLWEKWTPVIIYEILLLAVMGYLIVKGGKEEASSH